MRIDAYNKISQVYGVNGKVKTGSAAKINRYDEVNISSFGKELQIAKQAVSSCADVREDKVMELKSKIDNGTYEVTADSFADKLLAKYNEWMG